MPNRKGRPPVSGVMRNALVGTRKSDLHSVAVGVPIASLAPVPHGQLFCRLNRHWLLPDRWSKLTRHGDVIEWFDLPPGETPPA